MSSQPTTTTTTTILMDSTLGLAGGSTGNFRTSLQLQTPKPTTASVTAAFRTAAAAAQTTDPSSSTSTSTYSYSESDPNEARYWKNVYGLGPHTYSSSQNKFAHPRKLLLKPTQQTSIIQQVIFGPAATSATSSRAPLAVVGGPRIYLYGTNTVSAFSRHLAKHNGDNSNNNTTIEVSPDRMVQTGGHLALAADFRNDGRLIAVATEMGEVRICDVTMRATLCTFATSNSTLPMRAVCWFRNGQSILSGGDDGILRVWHLANAGGGNYAKPLLELKGHGDTIRTAILWQNSTKKNYAKDEEEGSAAYNQLAFSGSYDHTIRVWNVEDAESEADSDTATTDRCLAVLSHGAPVETLITMPSDDPRVPVWLLSAGGTTVKVWNPLTGECVSNLVTQHRKTITALLPVLRAPKTPNGKEYLEDLAEWRIVTGSLDGCIRIHTWSPSTGKLHHIHGLQVGDGTPITALAANTTGERIAIGTTAGTVFVRQRGPSKTQHKRKRQPIAGTYAFFTRGQNLRVSDLGGGDSSSNDYVLQSAKKKKLTKYDQCLKKFQYGDALDAALDTRMPQVVVAVLEELGKRRGLTIALSNRDEESLEPILSFLVRYVTRTRFTRVLIGVAHAIIDIYGDVAGQSETIDELFVKLKQQVATECHIQKSLHRLVGQIDAVLGADMSNFE